MSGRGLGVAAAATALLLAAEAPAHAHAVGLSNGDYRLAGRTLAADVSMSQRELVMLVPALDADHDGALDPEELAAGSAALARGVVGGLTVTSDASAPCPGALDRAWLLEGEGGVVIRAHYTCPGDPRRLTLAWPMLAGVTPGHRQLARMAAAGKAETAVIERARATWTVDVAGAPAVIERARATWTVDVAGAPAARPATSIARSMFQLGVEHILTGADHLVFLLALVLVGGSLRAMAGVVTAFTLAHSITLALGATGVLAPSPRIVEPLIALSIAYVGAENLFVKDARRRWRITFPFGLVHGFGFAGALREIALARGQVPAALVSFNLGVEAGQIAVLALVLPLATAARRAPRFGERGVRALSSAIALAGIVLFVVRIVARG